MLERRQRSSILKGERAITVVDSGNLIIFPRDKCRQCIEYSHHGIIQLSNVVMCRLWLGLEAPAQASINHGPGQKPKIKLSRDVPQKDI